MNVFLLFVSIFYAIMNIILGVGSQLAGIALAGYITFHFLILNYLMEF